MNEEVDALLERAKRLEAEIEKRVLGQSEVVRQLLITLIAGGHALVRGVPGLAKTLLVRALGEATHLSFKRVQFTPDLLPSDITGSEVLDENSADGKRAFRFLKGPVFVNLLLADEVNRTAPKTQAALLEAMAERQVSVGGLTYPLPAPFAVLATQNPIEQEGTYPLPEAQLDRFMFEIKIGYPTEADELAIIKRTTGTSLNDVEAILSGADIEHIQKLVRAVPVPDHVLRYALRLVRTTRVKEPMDGGGGARPKMVTDYVGWGAGPRASEYMVLAAKAKALLDGATHATPEHVRAVAKPVLRHRILTNFNAEADQVTTDAIIDAMLKDVPVEGASALEKKQMDAAMR